MEDRGFLFPLPRSRQTAIVALESFDAVYARADSRSVGKDEIADFYHLNRKINGKHTIDNILEKGISVVVQGIFKGQGADGSLKNMRFSDFWRFDKTLVSTRDTYLALGSDYVKD